MSRKERGGERKGVSRELKKGEGRKQGENQRGEGRKERLNDLKSITKPQLISMTKSLKIKNEIVLKPGWAWKELEVRT